jgi:hypothetical protein
VKNNIFKQILQNIHNGDNIIQLPYIGEDKDRQINGILGALYLDKTYNLVSIFNGCTKNSNSFIIDANVNPAVRDAINEYFNWLQKALSKSKNQKSSFYMSKVAQRVEHPLYNRKNIVKTVSNFLQNLLKDKNYYSDGNNCLTLDDVKRLVFFTDKKAKGDDIQLIPFFTFFYKNDKCNGYILSQDEVGNMINRVKEFALAYEGSKMSEKTKDLFYAFKDRENLTIEIDELKKLLGVSQKHQVTAIKDRFIAKTQKELLEKKGLDLSFKEIKNGKKVTHIYFEIKKANNNNIIDKIIADDKELDSFIKYIINYCI